MMDREERRFVSSAQNREGVKKDWRVWGGAAAAELVVEDDGDGVGLGEVPEGEDVVVWHLGGVVSLAVTGWMVRVKKGVESEE